MQDNDLVLYETIRTRTKSDGSGCRASVGTPRMGRAISIVFCPRASATVRSSPGLEAGCDTLFSEDLQHGRTIGTLRIQNPFIESPP